VLQNDVRATATIYRGAVPDRGHTDRSNKAKGMHDATTTPSANAGDAVGRRGKMNRPTATPIRIATTDGIACSRIATTLGVVLGIAIRSRGVGGNILAGFDALGNGTALAEYRDDLAAIRREALSRMAGEAEGLGATAVVGVRFDSAEVGREMVEVVAYGTAVVLQDA
jgi:uncharacterized protein YbjQ (UPF0145 family)